MIRYSTGLCQRGVESIWMHTTGQEHTDRHCQRWSDTCLHRLLVVVEAAAMKRQVRLLLVTAIVDVSSDRATVLGELMLIHLF